MRILIFMMIILDTQTNTQVWKDTGYVEGDDNFKGKVENFIWGMERVESIEKWCLCAYVSDKRWKCMNALLN